MSIFRFFGLLTSTVLFCTQPVRAAEVSDSLAEQANARRFLHIESNDTPGWPTGPAITAEAAILMEAENGTILYAKNIHEQLFPASTTKILTCLLAVENGKLSDEITFSQNAVFSLPPGSSNIGIDPGESLTLEQALFGILVGSANEVSNAVGEHIGGSIDGFVDMMNARATELGCTESHFANTNGLPDETHVTSAHDLAMIARAFFKNPLLSRISGTPSFHFSATEKQKDDFVIRNKHKLVNGELPCEGIIGGKTGYTDLARETLVTCAERNGMKLICVVLKEESPAQFTDTAALFDYGFNNFRLAEAAAEETRFLPTDPAFASSPFDIFGSAASVLSFGKGSVLLPGGIAIEDTETVISYGSDGFARIDYSWHDVPLGSAVIEREDPQTSLSQSAYPKTVTLRLFEIIPRVYGVAGTFCLIAFLVSFVRSWHFGGLTLAERRRYRRERKKRSKEGLHLGG
ncbi:MAG: D-alanyl-D-alanine carboxypeptidase [Lachnospiraceae bacterium]|nr:D-alanyl-D-alanine carboxypeptidase [Lachnospiraceae bacterium]